MKLLKAMATVGGFTGLSRILGFVRDILTAAVLGAGPIADGKGRHICLKRVCDDGRDIGAVYHFGGYFHALHYICHRAGF